MRYEHLLIIRLVLAFLFPYKFFAFVIFPLTFWLTKNVTALFLTFGTTGHSLIIKSYWLNFIPACAAISAYYLLFFLIVLTKNISFKKGMLMFCTGFLMILAMNLMRIEILIFILIQYGYNYFQATHIIFWEVVSTLYVGFTWIFLINIFHVKEIPVYSDVQTLVNTIRIRRPGKQAGPRS